MFSFLRKSEKPRQRSNPGRSFRPAVDLLEDRLALSTINLVNGELAVTTDQLDDRVSISRSGANVVVQVTNSAESLSFSDLASKVGRIVVATGAGYDRISLDWDQDDYVDIDIFAGADDDTIRLSASDGNLLAFNADFRRA